MRGCKDVYCKSLYMDKNSTRNGLIDCLRFIGLSLIILAHMLPPYILFNLRCFDVSMMLFVSGMVYSNRPIDFSISFFVRRLLRLIIPVYIFLTVYFFLVIALKFFVGIDFGVKIQHIIGSYVLIGGIWYVWIIRIFLLIAFLTPILITIIQVRIVQRLRLRHDRAIYKYLEG